ncbi:hypothetical protein M0R04_10105 [Candidatus Dojkabacteria bacterium]|jgi:hypothetical protein|nr:hypothetical protein [Candidatus Dojkabacteria bacterium]
MKKAKYKNKKFKSKEEFENWLKTYCEIKVVFEDDGQDFLEWFIDKNGEVLHSDFQSSIWNGKMVDLYRIHIGENLPLQDGSEIIHKVKKIIQFPFNQEEK